MGRLRYIIRTLKRMDKSSALNTVKAISARSGKSKLLVLMDVIWCGFRYGAGYTDYFDFYFDLADKQQRDTYVTRGRNNSLIKLLNKSSHRHLFANKDEFNAIFKDYLGRTWVNMDSVEERDFCSWVEGKHAVIAKPKDKMCGVGIEKLFVKDYDSCASMFAYLKNKSGYIVEDCLVQHPDLDVLYPGCINTIRVITVLVDGTAHVLATYLRIGNGGHVDNFNNGGMMTRVDTDTGKVMFAGVDLANRIYETHPITGTGIVGFQVPLWDESLRLTQEAAKLVPEVAYVGWDVAVTPDGPVLVEGNEFPGHHQHLPEYSPTDRGLMPDFLKLLNDHGILGKRKKL